MIRTHRSDVINYYMRSGYEFRSMVSMVLRLVNLFSTVGTVMRPRPRHLVTCEYLASLRRDRGPRTADQSRLLGRCRCRSAVFPLLLSYHYILVFLFNIRFLCVAVRQCCTAACLRVNVWCVVPATNIVLLRPVATRSSARTGYVEPVRRRRHEHCDLRNVAVVVRTERRICDLHLG